MSLSEQSTQIASLLLRHARSDELNALSQDGKRLKFSEREAIEAIQNTCAQAAIALGQCATALSEKSAQERSRAELDLIESVLREVADLHGTDNAHPLAAKAKTALEAIKGMTAFLNPLQQDWSMLEATREALREHMAEVHRLREALSTQEHSKKAPDGSAALQLADLVLGMDMVTEKGIRARDLARKVQDAQDESPAETALRAIACFLGVGGFNAPHVDAAQYQAKIIEELQRESTSSLISAPDWTAIEKIVDEFVEDYEMHGETDDGRDAQYTPNAGERSLIKDAIMGLLAHDEWTKAWSAQTQVAGQARGAVAGWIGGESLAWLSKPGRGDASRAQIWVHKLPSRESCHPIFFGPARPMQG